MKKFKMITAKTGLDLEAAVNKFFSDGGERWRVVSVTSGACYRTAWLEFEETEALCESAF